MKQNFLEFPEFLNIIEEVTDKEEYKKIDPRYNLIIRIDRDYIGY